MKAICNVLLAVLMLTVAPFAFGQQKPVVHMQGHALGEHRRIDCAAQAQVEAKKAATNPGAYTFDRSDFNRFMENCQQGDFEIDAVDNRFKRVSLVYQSWVLVRMGTIYKAPAPPSAVDILRGAIALYGKPTHKGHQTSEVSRWPGHYIDAYNFAWVFPGEYLALSFDVPSDYTGVTAAMMVTDNK